MSEQQANYDTDTDDPQPTPPDPSPSPWIVRKAPTHFNLEVPDRDVPRIARFYRAGDVDREEALHNAVFASLAHELWQAVEVLGGSPKGMKEYCQEHNLPVVPPDDSGGEIVNLSPPDWWRKMIRARIRDLAQRGIAKHQTE